MISEREHIEMFPIIAFAVTAITSAITVSSTVTAAAYDPPKRDKKPRNRGVAIYL